jgi:hypothetical protein
MDISKAKELLGFRPTATAEAIRQTVDFYEEAFYAFPNQRDEVLSELFASAIPKVRTAIRKSCCTVPLRIYLSAYMR